MTIVFNQVELITEARHASRPGNPRLFPMSLNEQDRVCVYDGGREISVVS